MARDIGGYFEQLTKKARGGRRLEPDEPVTDESGEEPADRPTTSGRAGGGISDVLKDILSSGRSKATTATKKAGSRARQTLDRRRAPKPTSSRTVGGSKADRNLPPEGVVTIEYSPQMDGDPDPGEVVWAWVPFEEDPEQGKDRPVVVIGRRGGKLVGVPLTTKRDEREAQITVGTGAWDPKRRTSYARIWRMLDIEAGDARREGAALERRRFDEVVVAVDRYYDVHRPATKSGSTRADSDEFDFDY